ncbi:MAG: amino acid ABC transporter substrate-binding protein [Anaerolineales bacterium]|jgi:general L-amino acid transport system substrate-binding protein
MSRKVFFLIASLVVLAFLVAACGGAATEAPAGGGETVVETVEVIKTVVVTVEVPAEAGEAPPAEVVGVGRGEIYNRVKERGKLVCGSRTDLLGFGYLNADGRNVGFDIDLCRAVAAAVLGDPEAVEFVPLTAAERGPALQTGEIDMLSRNVTWTSTRDSQWGNYTTVMFYDGQGYIVRKDSGVTEVEQLDGATVCVTTGTTTELNLADDFRQRGLSFEAVTFEDTASVYNAYEEGRCDAATSDKSQLAAVQAGFAEPDTHMILDVTISKEPLTPAVPHGDDQWFDIVKMVMYSLVNAEELGVTQANVDEMANSDNIQVRRLLGTEGEWGQADLGLDADAAVKAIKAVGNYGEIYDRYMGPNGDAFTLPRGINNLWTEGGLIYAPPMR